MSKEYVFIDCDGTIVSYHDRFYLIYSLACCQIGIKPMGRIDWLECRRTGTPTYSKEDEKKIFPIFDEMFESPEYLCFDRLIVGMDNVVNTLQKKYDTHIVSYRAKDKNLRDQLAGYGIKNINTITKGFSHDTPPDEKAAMIRRVIPNPSGWIIGDSPHEIIAGQRLGLKTIAVTWGDKDRKTIQRYNPNFIVDSSKEILDIINETTI